MQEFIKEAMEDAYRGIESFCTEDNYTKIAKTANLIAGCFTARGKVLICGNGGSNCDAVHFAEEFTGRFRKERNPLPVISLSDASHITCVANDYGFEEVFSRAVQAYGSEGDILIAISTSGNSENVIRAVRKAKELRMTTIGMLGNDGGKMSGLCDLQFEVKATSTDRIQEVHMLVLHIIIEMTERMLFPENYK